MWSERVKSTLDNALRDKQLDEPAYKRLIEQIENCPEDLHQEFMEDVVTAIRDHLLGRIVKGAEYIESIGKNHPNYTAAMNKYDALCEQLLNADRRKSRERIVPDRNRSKQDVG